VALCIKVTEFCALCWYDGEDVHVKLLFGVKEMHLPVGKYCLTPKDSFTLPGRI
jgi:hypothetical protein